MEQQEQLTEFKIQLALPAPKYRGCSRSSKQSSGTHKSIWILSILKPGRLHAEEPRCSFIWFKFNK